MALLLSLLALAIGGILKGATGAGAPIVAYGTTWTDSTLLETFKADVIEGRTAGRVFRVLPEVVTDGLFDLPGSPKPTDDSLGVSGAGAPLAVRMRPASLDEVVGQEHLLAAGSPLRRLVEGSGVASAILYGPPGSGKSISAPSRVRKK